MASEKFQQVLTGGPNAGLFFRCILPERTQLFRFCLKRTASFKDLLQSAGEVSAAHLRRTKYVGQVCEGKTVFSLVEQGVCVCVSAAPNYQLKRKMYFQTH